MTVDHSLKYFSRTRPLGSTYIHKEKIPFTDGIIAEIVKEIELLTESLLT